MASRLLSVREVAARLGLGRATVNQYARAGLLPGVQYPSGLWRFEESDVEAFFEASRRRGRAAVS